jgi:hypothetical protein
MSCLCQNQQERTLTSLYESIRLIAKTPRESHSEYQSCERRECQLLKVIFERIENYLSEARDDSEELIPRLERVLGQLSQLRQKTVDPFPVARSSSEGSTVCHFHDKLELVSNSRHSSTDPVRIEPTQRAPIPFVKSIPHSAPPLNSHSPKFVQPLNYFQPQNYLNAHYQCYDNYTNCYQCPTLNFSSNQWTGGFFI